MAASDESQQPELSGGVMFYRQPEALSLQRHRTLGIKPVENPFSFISTAHVIPLTVDELQLAGVCYPIIFAGPNKAPLGVMGPREGENVFLKDNVLEPDVYLPGFVRRYPFVFATDATGEQYVPCIDRAAPMVAENAETPFFEGEQLSKFTQDCIEFCKAFEQSRLLTMSFVNIVTECDLWEPKTISLTGKNPDGSDGETFVLADFFAISDVKLQALSPELSYKLQAGNWLLPIYAHLMSQNHWGKLLNRSWRNSLKRAEFTTGLAPH